MSELDANVVIDGQRAVATVPQTGTVIQDGGAIDATCVIQTDNGAQKAVKTYDLNGGGGGGTVDQTYDATSTNAQSGTAVAEAVAPALKNTATGTDSLTLLNTNGTSRGYSIVIGKSATALAYTNMVSIGNSARTSGSNGIAIGSQAQANSTNAISIGSYTFSQGVDSIAIGSGNTGSFASANASIQLGEGTNSTANSFQVYSYTMLDKTTGKIPMARLPIVQISQADYDALVSGGTVDANTLYLIV